MASTSVLGRRYLAEELVTLRTSVPAIGSVLEKLKNHPEISTIYRTPQGGATNHRPPFSNPKSLSEITNRQRSRLDIQKDVTDSSDESEFQHVAGQNIDHRHVHWNFRKRDSSDHSSQPHSAPTGIAAQQSENFQRFYRAVVSPTHVRVTAGGRIVPNTRAVAPPLFDWNSDKFRFDAKKSTIDPEPYPLQPSAWPLGAPFPTGYPSLMPGGFLPAFNFLQKNASIALPPMASQIQHGFAGDLTPSDRGQAPQVSGEIIANISQGALPQQVKISHPSQFDHSKPFTFNGHIVYPLPQGFQPPQHAVPMPISMLTPNMMTQAAVVPQASGYLSQFPQLSLLPNPLMFQQAGQQAPMMFPSCISASETAAPAVPPIQMGIVPVSELLSAQIQLLRTQLKNIEDVATTQNNPIGENVIEQQRAILHGQIASLENFLQTQIAQEELSKKASISNTDQMPTITAQTNFSLLETSSTKKDNMTENEGMKNEHFNSSKAPNASQQTLKPDQGTKSRLTLAAAMAPPFKPRAKSVATNATNGVSSSTTSPETDVVQSSETDEQIEARLLSRSDTDWGQPSIFGNSEMSFTFPKAQSFQEGSNGAHIGGTVPSYQRSHTYNGTASPSVASIVASQTVPYLVGTLPRGIPTTMVKPDDIAYSRPLTDDELRARYLYWGKAPRSVQSGLPKFDGKDFYPPSPIKGNAQPVRTNQHVSTLVDPNGTPAPMDFSKLFDGYKTPSPVHRLHLQNVHLAPVPQPIFEKTISPTEDSSTRNGSVKSAWSTTYTESHQMTYQPSTPPPVVQSNIHSNVGSDEDFSNLFITKSPSPPRPQAMSSHNGRQGYSPNTPSDLKLRFENADNGEVQTQDSWGQPLQTTNELAVQTPDSPEKDGHSSDSTVEIQLSPRVKVQTFAERVENFRAADQQTLFLQNMLRAQPPPMTTSALSGAITSATAQGFLPRNRGSAAASLAPTIQSVYTTSSIDHLPPKATIGKATTISVSPLVVSSSFSETRPLKDERSLNGMTYDGSGAEGYMRYLTKKEDSKKKVAEQSWGSTTPDNVGDW